MSATEWIAVSGVMLIVAGLCGLAMEHAQPGRCGQHLLVVLLSFAATMGFLLLCFGCGSAPRLMAETRVRPEADAGPQQAEAGGDLTQFLQQQQETLNRLVSVQQSQATHLADRIDRVGELTQDVQTQMYDLGPRRAEFESERLGIESALKDQMLGVLVGVLILAIAAPAFGGPWFYIVGIIVIVVALFGPKLFGFLL